MAPVVSLIQFNYGKQSAHSCLGTCIIPSFTVYISHSILHCFYQKLTLPLGGSERQIDTLKLRFFSYKTMVKGRQLINHLFLSPLLSRKNQNFYFHTYFETKIYYRNNSNQKIADSIKQGIMKCWNWAVGRFIIVL